MTGQDGMTGKSNSIALDRRDILRLALMGIALPWPAGAATLRSAALGQLEPSQLAALVRAVADAEPRCDPVLFDVGTRLVALVAEIMPEAHDLLILHRLHRMAPARGVMRPPLAVDLGALHAACHDCREIRVTYTDAAGAETRRDLRPIEVFHNPDGIYLIAWCTLRRDIRWFYAHRMRDLEVRRARFAHDRATLIALAIARAEERYQD